MAASKAAAPRGSAGRGGGSGAVMKLMNRQISTFRGTACNAYGDLSDVGVPYLTGVQAALAETSDTVFDAATQRQQIIRGVQCRVPAWADIITTDTLLDPASGLYYMITSIEAEPGPGYYPQFKILTLRDRSGVSIQSD